MVSVAVQDVGEVLAGGGHGDLTAFAQLEQTEMNKKKIIKNFPHSLAILGHLGGPELAVGRPARHGGHHVLVDGQDFQDVLGGWKNIFNKKN